MNTISIRAIRHADAKRIAAIVRLYQEVGWWQDEYTADFIPPVLQKSFCVIAAFDGTELVGMGRAISDGVSDAYIQDVAVLHNYRGQGIATRIVEKILERLRRRHIDWIGLIGAPGTDHLYHRLGFEPMPGYQPMMLVPSKLRPLDVKLPGDVL